MESKDYILIMWTEGHLYRGFCHTG